MRWSVNCALFCFLLHACTGASPPGVKCCLLDTPDRYLQIVFHDDDTLGGSGNICRLGPETVKAKILILLEGIDQLEGLRLEGDEFADRVEFYCLADEDVPPFSGNFCEIETGGDVGERLSGKCAFAFDNGYFLTATFECELEMEE